MEGGCFYWVIIIYGVLWVLGKKDMTDEALGKDGRDGYFPVGNKLSTFGRRINVVFFSQKKKNLWEMPYYSSKTNFSL